MSRGIDVDGGSRWPLKLVASVSLCVTAALCCDKSSQLEKGPIVLSHSISSVWHILPEHHCPESDFVYEIKRNTDRRKRLNRGLG